MIAPEGPYLLASILCERVLEEKDGSLTAVRLLDRLLIPGPPEPGTTPVVGLMLLLVLRKGEAPTSHSVNLAIQGPSGRRHAYPDAQTVDLGREPDEGLNLRVGLNLEVEEEGIHWIEVLVDGLLANRVPLRISFVPAATLEPGQESSMSELGTEVESRKE